MIPLFGDDIEGIIREFWKLSDIENDQKAGNVWRSLRCVIHRPEIQCFVGVSLHTALSS